MPSEENMGMELGGRVAIVTGAGGGLGRSHALLLARHGARVVVNDWDGDAATAVAAEIVAAGGTAMAAPASVTDEAEVAAMVHSATLAWGWVDILVNNAGILRDKSFAKMDMADFRLVVERLLEPLDEQVLPPDRLRVSRVLMALEQAGPGAARELLQALANGCPGAWLTQEARRGLTRLDVRN